ncbi:hypothetical protein NPIL_634711 [Nephila pilipes]|uniref:Uncharacterized protein n=1 Tax=Nephila pilipes TaxID=299642 RepID=A0A8X6SZG0_NEPPI|nr:hypothetical protein NPIL_634711 [Nephila pilipes]
MVFMIYWFETCLVFPNASYEGSTANFSGITNTLNGGRECKKKSYPASMRSDPSPNWSDYTSEPLQIDAKRRSNRRSRMDSLAAERDASPVTNQLHT